MLRLQWIMAAAALLLAGCGGGSEATPAPPASRPTIVEFSVDSATVRMGDRAQLTPVFGGGSGRIVPDIGPVRSGVTVSTPVLEGDVTYRLIVEADGEPAATRTLSLSVNHQDRYVAAGSFASEHHAAVELPDGSVLVVGGWRGASVLSNSIDRFDPATRTFRQVGEMATGRAWARPVVLADGRVLVTGGSTSIAAGVTYELIDVAAGRVSPAGTPVRNRVGHTATRLLDGRVLIAGGFEDRTAEIWDPATGGSRPVAARMANPREWHTATLLADGRVLLVGGFTTVPAYWLAEIFDPRTEQFTPLGAPRFAPHNEALGLHAAHRLADGSVLIAGGEHFIANVDQAARPTAAVLRFDPVAGAFTPETSLLAPRTLPATARLADDRVLLLGGLGADGTSTATGESYRAGRDRTAMASLEVARVHHTVSRLPGGRLLVLGGEAPDGTLVPSVLIYE
jgi:hypothetical protein